MYIKKANIYGFGKLVDVSFEFHKDYQVIRGLNESGKTTLLSFIKSVLFGFADGKKKYEQYIPKDSSKYGGELILDDGNSEWTIKRIKGKNGGEVSVFRGDEEFPGSTLEDIIHNIDKKVFENLYVLNQDNIKNVISLKRKDLITEVLRVGAVGSVQWVDLMNQIDKDSESIYKTGSGAKKPLNIALKEYDSLVDKRSEYQDQLELFSNKSKEEQELKNSLNNLNKKRVELGNKIISNTRILEKQFEYQEYLNLENIKNNETISDSDWDLFKEAQQKVSSIKDNLKTLQNSIPKIEESSEILLNNYKLHKDEIDNIREDIDLINNKEFSLEQLNSEILKSKEEKDRLLASNDKLSEELIPLPAQSNSYLESNNKINLYTMFFVGLITVFALVLLPMNLKFLSVFGFLGSAWFGYKYKNEKNTKYDEYLNKYNYSMMTINDALAIQPEVNQLQKLTTDINRLTKQYSAEKDKIEEWKNKVKSLNIVSFIDVKHVNHYFEELNYLLKKQDDINHQRENFIKKSNELNKEVISLTETQNELLKKYDLQNIEDFSKKRQVDSKLHEKLNRKKILKEALDNKFLDELINKSSSFDLLEKDLVNYKDELNKVDEEIKLENNNYAKLKLDIESLVSDEDYLILEQRINDKQSEIIELYDDWVAQKLSAQWIYETLNLASSNRFPKMLERSKKYFKILSNENYSDIEFGEKKITVQNKNLQKYDLQELSKGTIAQLYISLRCAFVMEISDIVELPVLIDDAFSDFDKIRYKAAIDLIKTMAQDNQIFYVTTNNISVDYFDGKHVINLGEYDG